MSPYTQYTEVSTKQLKPFSASNIQTDTLSLTAHYQATQSLLVNNANNTNYEHIVSEIEGFIINDLNRSIGDDSSSNTSSMDEILNGSANPFDDLLSSIDTSCQIKIESSIYDPYNMYIDNNADYQQLYSPYTLQLQQMPNNNVTNFHDSQIYNNNSTNHSVYNNNHNYQSHQKSISSPHQSHLSVLPTTSNQLLDSNSIKQESSILEDNSESSYCSSNETFETSVNNNTNSDYQINHSMPLQTMSLTTYKSMSKQSRVSYEKRYGPIVVRPRKNPAPTLASGRKSKYTILNADEERKREIRRLRNRQAAEKCKQKRSEIEEQLESKMKYLEKEKMALSTTQAQLNEKKSQLETALKEHFEQCTSQQNSQGSIPYKQQSSNNNNISMYSNQQQHSQHPNANMNLEYNIMVNNMNTPNLLLSNSNTQAQYTNYIVPYASDQMRTSYGNQPSNNSPHNRLLAEELQSKSYY